MTYTPKTVTQRQDPAPVLRHAVQAAQRELLESTCDLASVDEALARLFTELAPVHDELAATAAADPGGPVAAVLAHLRTTFAHAAAGDPDPAVIGVITAATTAIRLADDTALTREYADVARWR